MDLHLIAVGRLRRGPEQELFNHYSGRLKSRLNMVEVEEKRPLPSAELKVKEGELLLSAIPKGAFVIALDERGKTFDSVSFSEKLTAIRDEGYPALAILIGGADGLDQPVRDRANLTLSLGKLTWPHMLVRGLIAEQLYRAQQIAIGHPYHRA